MIDPDEEIVSKYTLESSITDKTEILFLEETFFGILRFQTIIKVISED